ncbi:hypothetical protein [Pseudarthrobacter sp. fls2-241-R2A-168]|uniref:hypothetical protein n=1 Tax=Pseudarthrobacter sp. fls2-241-R2A-168 TaxID=3040304 RepID=UPI002553D3C0|nr:hypothetical protein [Pseudarthrobacter sp. fls2-241-R2A-168]
MDIENWENLQGQQVLIRKNGKLVRNGLVEEVAPGGDALWIENYGADLRQLFLKEEGYSVELSPPLKGM